MAVKTSTLLIGGGIAAAVVYMLTRRQTLDLPQLPSGSSTSISLESPAAPDINLAVEAPQAAPSSGGFDLASIFALMSLNQPAAAPAPVIVLPPNPVTAPAPVAAPAFDLAGFLAAFLSGGTAVGSAAAELGLTGDLDQGATDGGPVDLVDFNLGDFVDAGGFTELELDNIFGFGNPAPAPAPATDFTTDFEESGFFFESGSGGSGDIESPLARMTRILGIPGSSDLGSIDLPNFGDVVPVNPDGTVNWDALNQVTAEVRESLKFEVPEFNIDPFSSLKSAVNEAGQDFKVVTEGATGLAYLGGKLPVAGKILTKLPVFGVASKLFLPLTVLDLLVTGYEFYTGNNVPVLGNRELIMGFVN